jgi:hypothetical protein
VSKTQEVTGRVIVRRIDCQAILNQQADIWRIIANTLREAELNQMVAADIAVGNQAGPTACCSGPKNKHKNF